MYWNRTRATASYNQLFFCSRCCKRIFFLCFVRNELVHFETDETLKRQILKFIKKIKGREKWSTFRLKKVLKLKLSFHTSRYLHLTLIFWGFHWLTMADAAARQLQYEYKAVSITTTPNVFITTFFSTTVFPGTKGVHCTFRNIRSYLPSMGSGVLCTKHKIALVTFHEC